MRITRFPSISEHQFIGCTAAFVDSFFGELHSAAIALRRLEGRGKGDAFAYEMELDTHRYGALIVLDRWNSLVGTFGPHLSLSQRPAIIEDAPGAHCSRRENPDPRESVDRQRRPATAPTSWRCASRLSRR